MLYLLMKIEWDDTQPLAVYRSRELAEAEARRLEAAYAAGKDVFDDWCRRRSDIAQQWRREGRFTTPYFVPNWEGEKELLKLVGPRPPLEGHEACDVWEIEDRT